MRLATLYKRERLGEVFQFIRNGASIKQGNPGGIPITRIETIAEGKLDFTRLGYAGIVELGKYEDYVLVDGDILMSHINSETHLGKAAFVENLQEAIIHGMNLLCLRANSSVLYPKYAYHYFKSPFFRNQLFRITKKSVNQASFSVSDLKRLGIILPPLETQRRIADVLDKAQELIDKRKQQIELLDELLKSVFLDMFGDPFSNSKGWGVVPLGNLAKLEGGFAFRSIDYTGKGIRLVRIANVHYEHLDWGDVCFLPSSYEEEYKHYSLSAGDILIAMTRPIIKSLDSVKVARVRDSDLPCLLNQRVGRFKILDKRLVDEYLYQFCLSSYVKNFVEKFSSVSLQPNISSKQIEAIPIPLPPRDSQLKFRDVFYSVVAQQESMRKSLAYMGDNFNSIMQRAFKGELFS